MHITKVETRVVGFEVPHHGGVNFLFVKLLTDEGLHGGQVDLDPARRLLSELSNPGGDSRLERHPPVECRHPPFGMSY